MNPTPQTTTATSAIGSSTSGAIAPEDQHRDPSRFRKFTISIRRSCTPCLRRVAASADWLSELSLLNRTINILASGALGSGIGASLGYGTGKYLFAPVFGCHNECNEENANLQMSPSDTTLIEANDMEVWFGDYIACWALVGFGVGGILGCCFRDKKNWLSYSIARTCNWLAVDEDSTPLDTVNVVAEEVAGTSTRTDGHEPAECVPLQPLSDPKKS